MGSKSAITLFFLLSYASCILQISGKHLSPHARNGNNPEGDFTTGQRFSDSPQNSSIKNPEPSENIIHQYASYSLFQPLLGVKAKMTIWKTNDVQPRSNSSSYIEALRPVNGGTERIIAGVHVSPALYGGSQKPHFFTYWSSSSNLNGCYNLNCPGFVVADGANVHPGQGLSPPSDYGKLETYITIRIKKDLKTGDWSLYREDEGGPIGGMTLLGWWPKTLFTNLSDHASMVTWTGSVFYPESERSPSMGSGHFASELEKKAACFKQIAAFDLWGKMFEAMSNMVIQHMSNRDCYTVSQLYYSNRPGSRSHFFYGGPGGCTKV